MGNDLAALIKSLDIETTYGVEEESSLRLHNLDSKEDDSVSVGSSGLSDKENINVNSDQSDVKQPKAALFLKIAPRIEQRIINIANNGKVDKIPKPSSRRDIFEPSKWHKLPPWLHLTEKPSGVESLAAFIGTADH